MWEAKEISEWNRTCDLKATMINMWSSKKKAFTPEKFHPFREKMRQQRRRHGRAMNPEQKRDVLRGMVGLALNGVN